MSKGDEHVKADVAHVNRRVTCTKAAIRPKDELDVGTFAHENGPDLVRVRLEPIGQLDEDHFCILLLDLLDGIIKLEIGRLVLDCGV
jgi:hypothetical protein